MNALRAVPDDNGGSAETARADLAPVETDYIDGTYDNPATDAEALLLCALMWSYKGQRTSPEIARITTTLTTRDFLTSSYGTIFGHLADLVRDGAPHDVAGVTNALIQGGAGTDGSGNLRMRLMNAATAGADELSATHYADMVLSQAYRRSFRLVGAAITEAAERLPEEDLFAHMVEHGRRQRAAYERLNQFRSGQTETGENPA
ncbi:DnaB-like helicase N-terminal domain-containing protein [Rhodococcoides yunnanense]|uniref:DnaB-like helicase N-terminal domain-containing protein n=1 Tax=Rhodococcoides yunnanense TaxID=278209 RepID=UPI0022B1979B|nr:DnaB-like helicase N-terminal domain-containing protein [Rhodococcus yunnanensis]MCZ4277428.1 DNA helicase [Rhodococcus yunnanensis]